MMVGKLVKNAMRGSMSVNLTTLPGNTHRVVIAGGSYGGLSTAINLLALQEGIFDQAAERTGATYPSGIVGQKLEQNLEIVVVDERDGFFHTVGAPLAHVSREHVQPFWKKFSNIKSLKRPNVHFVQGSVENVDTQNMAARVRTTGSGANQKIPYHSFVAATGLQRAWPIVPNKHNFEGYVNDANALIENIGLAEDVMVIGGGAVGVEIAAEIKNYHPSNRVILVHSRSEVLSNEPLPAEFKERALTVLHEEGVETVLQTRARIEEESGNTSIVLANGRTIEANVVIDATAKVSPATTYFEGEALDDDSYVRVTPNLSLEASLPNAACHYAVGDVVRWSGIKRAGAALAMGRIAAVNIFAGFVAAEAGHKGPIDLVAFPEVPPMMALAVGNQAVAFGPGQGVTHGKESMQMLFGDDLGWSMTLKYMGLSEVAPTESD